MTDRLKTNIVPVIVTVVAIITRVALASCRGKCVAAKRIVGEGSTPTITREPTYLALVAVDRGTCGYSDIKLIRSYYGSCFLILFLTLSLSLSGFFLSC